LFKKLVIPNFPVAKPFIFWYKIGTKRFYKVFKNNLIIYKINMDEEEQQHEESTFKVSDDEPEILEDDILDLPEDDVEGLNFGGVKEEEEEDPDNRFT
jgi:hypothetical protein